MDETWRVLALPPLPESAMRGFLGDGAWDLTVPAERTQRAAMAAAAEAEIIVGDWSHQILVDADLAGAAPHLCYVVQPAVGTDTIDLKELAAQGIPVTNAGTANAVAVAEWCVLATLALLRRPLEADAAVRAGDWPQLTMPLRELADLRVGILGMGGVAEATAHRLDALGARVSYWSRSKRPHLSYGYLAQGVLIAQSDLLIAVLPSTPQTRGLLDAAALATMPSGAMLVSAGRGDILDETALAAALSSGHLGGAALDVYVHEPLPADSPLRAAPHLMLAPHQGGATRNAQLRIVGTVLENLQRVRRGEPVRDVVNGVDPRVRRR